MWRGGPEPCKSVRMMRKGMFRCVKKGTKWFTTCVVGVRLDVFLNGNVDEKGSPGCWGGQRCVASVLGVVCYEGKVR